MTTVTRIKVPTAQDWATGPNALRHPTATDADSRDQLRTAALIAQPATSLICPLPGGGNSPVPVIANTTQAPERTGLLKRVALVVSLALALLLAKAAFGETSAEELIMTSTPTPPTETTPSEAPKVSAPAPGRLPAKPPARTNIPTAQERAPTTTSAAVVPEHGMASEFARLAKFATPAMPAPVVGMRDATMAMAQRSEGGANSGAHGGVPTSLAAAIALTLLGAGVASYVGNVTANRRRDGKRDDAREPEEQHTEVETSNSPPGPPVSQVPAVQSPAQPAVAVALPAPTPPSASRLAYIEPTDWMAAIERSHGVNARPGPQHAVVSVAGTRDGNEDYVCAFELQDRMTHDTLHCMLVADGCGGHAGGRDASCLAVRAASEALISCHDVPPGERVRIAFDVASQALIDAGKQWPANSLRTTLIVVVATRTTYYCGWIGDGGIDLHRADGRWESLLKAHKSGAQNLLAASLGPDLVGAPSFANHPRIAGDRLYLGSDGVFEVYDDVAAFWGTWFEAESLKRAPATCLRELLDACAKHSAFDDNMSVAYLATPAPAAPPNAVMRPTAVVTRAA